MFEETIVVIKQMSQVQDKCMHKAKKCMRNAMEEEVVLEIVKGDKPRMAVLERHDLEKE